MNIFWAYLITFGWALVGSVSMGAGIILGIKMFELSTRDVNEWELIKNGNMAMALVLASVILGIAFVVGSAIQQ